MLSWEENEIITTNTNGIMHARQNRIIIIWITASAGLLTAFIGLLFFFIKCLL